MKPNLKLRAKILLRSRSLRFTRDYFARGASRGRASLSWRGLPVHYRPGTSDTTLIYNILLREGAKSEYAVPPHCPLDPRAVKVVLDIGANIGIAAIHFAQLFPRATVHAFEPEPGNCEMLRANTAAHPRIRVHAFALGAADGELALFDGDDNANRGGFSAYGSSSQPGRSTSVPVRHSGRALAALGLSAVDVIKIDTEGAEWEILTSLDPQLLGGVQLIMGELHGRRDFALLEFLQPMFRIGVDKKIKSELFNFYAVNRNLFRTGG